MEVLEVHSEDVEDHPGDPREPPVRREEKGTHRKEEGGFKVLAQQDGVAFECQAHRHLLQEG